MPKYRYHFCIPDPNFSGGVRILEAYGESEKVARADLPAEGIAYIKIWEQGGTPDAWDPKKTCLVDPQIFDKAGLIKWMVDQDPDSNPAAQLAEFPSDVWYAWVHAREGRVGVMQSTLGQNVHLLLVGEMIPQDVTHVTHDGDERYCIL